MGTQQTKTKHDYCPISWQTKLDKIYSDAISELKNGNKSLAIKYFEQCIELETTNSIIIDKRFYIMTEIILLQTEMMESVHVTDNDILLNFSRLLKYYNAKNPTQYITTENLKGALRSLFHFMQTSNIHLLLNLANFALNYFKSLNIENQHVKCILHLLQNEYISKFDTIYFINIQKCDKYKLYNAINDKNKIVIDLSDNEKYLKLHMNGAINIDFNQYDKKDDKLIFDTFYDRIQVINIDFIEIYFSFDDMKYGRNDIITFLQNVQKVIWKKLFKVIPFYVYENDMNIFDNQYPYLCKSSVSRRYQMRSLYPSQIIDDKLYLGDIKQAQNTNKLKALQITHIINCTESDYKNEDNIEYLRVNIDDNESEQIDEYFQMTYEFINSVFDVNECKILVHCRAGVSRSSTIVIAFLMKKYNISLKDAMKMVQSKRSKIKPNRGFVKQLQKYQNNTICN